MSAEDIETILNTPKLFLFIPAVNYVYITSLLNTNNSFYFTIAAIFTSAFLYNILDGVPVRKAKKVGIKFTISFIISFVVWLFTLVKSAVELKAGFEQQGMISEVLFFTTIGFVAVVSTHLALTGVDQYRNSM